MTSLPHSNEFQPQYFNSQDINLLNQYISDEYKTDLNDDLNNDLKDETINENISNDFSQDDNPSENNLTNPVPLRGGLVIPPQMWKTNPRLKSNTSSKSSKTNTSNISKPRFDYLRFIRDTDYNETITFITGKELNRMVESLYSKNEIEIITYSNGKWLSNFHKTIHIEIIGVPDIEGSIYIALNHLSLLDKNWESTMQRLLENSPESLELLSQLSISYVHVELKGKCCERYSLNQQRNLVQYFVKKGFKCTNLHGCFDDYGKRFPMDNIKDTPIKCRTGLKKIQPPLGIDIADRNKSFQELKNWLVYVGTYDSSKKFTRIYDTWKKHGYHAWRVETVFGGEYAKELVKELLEVPTALLDDWLYGVILGTMDFHYESKYKNDRHKKHRQRMEFWQEYLDFIGTDAVKVTWTKTKSTIQQKLQWLFKQVARTLALVGKIFPKSIQELLAAGRERFSNTDLKQIQYLLELHKAI